MRGPDYPILYHFDQFAAAFEILKFMNPDLESGAKNEVKPYFLMKCDRRIE